MLDLVEEAFDEVSFTIERKIAQTLDKSVCPGWNDDASAVGFDDLNDCVAVVTLVGQNVVGGDAFHQRFCLGVIGSVAGRQNEAQGIAKSVAQSMQLCRQSAARAADGFRLLIPPFAPALC